VSAAAAETPGSPCCVPRRRGFSPRAPASCRRAPLPTSRAAGPAAPCRTPKAFRAALACLGAGSAFCCPHSAPVRAPVLQPRAVRLCAAHQRHPCRCRCRLRGGQRPLRRDMGRRRRPRGARRHSGSGTRLAHLPGGFSGEAATAVDRRPRCWSPQQSARRAHIAAECIRRLAMLGRGATAAVVNAGVRWRRRPWAGRSPAMRLGPRPE
jgi:hypothetical protein